MTQSSDGGKIECQVIDKIQSKLLFKETLDFDGRNIHQNYNLIDSPGH